MICSNKTYFNNQIEMIKSFTFWNVCPTSIRNFLIRKLKTKYENYSTSTSNADSQTDENIAKIWIKIPYLGNRDENIIKSCTSKIQRFLTKPIKFIIIYDTKRISSQTKTNFLFYHVVILFTRFRVRVVAKGA